MSDRGDSNLLSSVSNALHLLTLLSDEPETRVTDVARRLDVAPSTAHRLLSRLLDQGFVRRVDESKRYTVGPELLRVARAISARNSLEQSARPHLESLCGRVEETVNIHILERCEVVCLDAVPERRHAIHVPHIAGHRVAAHASASGKALLASLPELERTGAYAQERLVPLTKRTITDPGRFADELARVRANGFATSLEERDLGVHSVAVVVQGLDSLPLAAVSVAAPAERMPPARIPGLVSSLRKTASAVTAAFHATADPRLGRDPAAQ